MNDKGNILIMGAFIVLGFLLVFAGIWVLNTSSDVETKDKTDPMTILKNTGSLTGFFLIGLGLTIVIIGVLLGVKS